MGKIKNIVAVVSLITNAVMLDRFLTDAINAVALTVIAAVMAGLFMVGGFIALFFCITQYGVSPALAALIVAGIALLITISLIALVVHKLRSLKKPSHYMPHGGHFSGLSQVGKVITAFLDGFHGR